MSSDCFIVLTLFLGRSTDHFLLLLDLLADRNWFERHHTFGWNYPYETR